MILQFLNLKELISREGWARRGKWRAILIHSWDLCLTSWPLRRQSWKRKSRKKARTHPRKACRPRLGGDMLRPTNQLKNLILIIPESPQLPKMKRVPSILLTGLYDPRWMLWERNLIDLDGCEARNTWSLPSRTDSLSSSIEVNFLGLGIICASFLLTAQTARILKCARTTVSLQ